MLADKEGADCPREEALILTKLEDSLWALEPGKRRDKDTCD
jgi:hypothetical protein